MRSLLANKNSENEMKEATKEEKIVMASLFSGNNLLILSIPCPKNC